MKLRDYQERAIVSLRDVIRSGKKRPIMALPCGGGKCLGKDTPVMMHDGKIKMSQHIEVLDRLMGPDSCPRLVLSTTTGVGQMYEITPKKGDSYVVNGAHILSLKIRKGAKLGKLKDGTIVNIPVDEYLKKSETFKGCAKGYRVPLLFGPEPISLSPYFLGLWLGDGDSDRPFITSADKEIIEFLKGYAILSGLKLRTTGIRHSMSGTKKILNPITHQLRNLDVIKNKHIPDVYKYNLRMVRLDVLAGLIDSDGHLGHGYDIIFKSEKLADDTVFIARSLGLAAYKTKCKKTCTNTGATGIYHRISISGDIDMIPCKVKRKIAPSRRQIKDPLVTGIKVKKVGYGYYYGFELDGDGLFLLEDFTVTHNSHIFGQVIANVLEKDKTVLWLVHRRNLVYQMQDVLEKHFDIHPGIIMAGIESDTSLPVQLSTIQTYHRRLKLDPLDYKNFHIRADVVLIDEGHRSLSKTYMDVIKLYQDEIVMSCTATPMRADGRGMSEVYDSIIDVAGVQELIDRGYLSPVRYFVPYEPDLEGVKIAMGDYVVKELDEKMNKPKLTGAVVENWLLHAENRKTIVFAVNVKHSIALKDEFCRMGVNAEHLDARSPDDERQAVFDAMGRDEVTVICNVALYQEGLDVPDVSCIVMARPTKSLGLFRQCGGRGLRPFPGKEDCLFFDHGGVLRENGYLEDEIEWSLDGKERAFIRKVKPGERKPVVCRACKFVFEGSNKCPRCGSPVKSFGKMVETREAEMRELKKKESAPASMADKRRFYGMLEYERRMRKYAEGWTAHKFKSKFGTWPKGLKDTGKIQPDAKFFNWITYQNIKYHKGLKKTEAVAA